MHFSHVLSNLDLMVQSEALLLVHFFKEKTKLRDIKWILTPLPSGGDRI